MQAHAVAVAHHAYRSAGTRRAAPRQRATASSGGTIAAAPSVVAVPGEGSGTSQAVAVSAVAQSSVTTSRGNDREGCRFPRSGDGRDTDAAWHSRFRPNRIHGYDARPIRAVCP